MTGTAAAFRLSTRLFWLDRGVVFGTVVTPVVLCVGMPVLMGALRPDGVAGAVQTFVGGLAIVLSVSTFMSIVQALTARRDQLLLKRLRTTLLTERQILVGEISGQVVQTVALVAVCTLAVHLAADVPLPRNPLLYAVFVVAGTTVVAILGAAFTALVPRLELAAVMSMPFFLVAGVGAGAMGPFMEMMPTALRMVFAALPTDAVVTVARTTIASGTIAGDLRAALVPAIKLVVWGLIGIFALARWFRWEPRRS
ncbi:ABC transporter permease [Plantactinospora sp. B5E13]|uniref:ABC transporter permease n=1 Tax=unclassified Plantactinospora TaxID=2631981 RepID=UPI00325E7A11